MPSTALQSVGQEAECKFESKFKPFQLLGQCLGTAWAGWTGEHKHRALHQQRT